MNKVLLCACAALMSAVSLCAQQKVERLPVAEVGLMENFQTRRYPGRIVSVAEVTFVARVNGEIMNVGFKNGDIVKAGQLLFELDSVKYRAAVKNAEAKIAEYKARMAYAESSYQRNLKLSTTQAVSKDTLENSLSERNAYQAALAAAEADLVAAKKDLANCQITAPISGKMGTTKFTLGNYVTTSSGTLVNLVQTSPIRARFSISNRDYLAMFGGSEKNIQEHGTIDLTLANGKKFNETGKIEYVENTADSTTDTIQVYAVFPNQERILNAGAIVEIELKNTVGEKLPAVPHTAILQDVKGSYVWVLDDKNNAAKRYIVRGSATDDHQLVDSGLKEGERIVTDGVHKVRPGGTVEPLVQKQ